MGILTTITHDDVLLVSLELQHSVVSATEVHGAPEAAQLSCRIDWVRKFASHHLSYFSYMHRASSSSSALQDVDEEVGVGGKDGMQLADLAKQLAVLAWVLACAQCKWLHNLLNILWPCSEL